MVKSSSSSVTNVKTCLRKGKWSPEEEQKLMAYINKYGIWNWVETPKAAGLLRSGKSCRLRWMNYLRPGIKHGNFSQEEDATIIKLQQLLGNRNVLTHLHIRLSTIATRLPGRTDNEIKNQWHTNLKKYCLKNNLLQAEIETITDDEKNPSEDDGVLLSNTQKASSFNYGSECSANCSPLMPSQPSFDYCFPSSSCDPSCEICNNQTTEDNNGSSKTYVELQSLWDPAPTYPIEGIYMVGDCGATIDPGFLFSNTSTLASYYDAGDDLSAYLLMQTNEESV